MVQLVKGEGGGDYLPATHCAKALVVISLAFSPDLYTACQFLPSPQYLHTNRSSTHPTLILLQSLSKTSLATPFQAIENFTTPSSQIVALTGVFGDKGADTGDGANVDSDAVGEGKWFGVKHWVVVGHHH